MVRPCGKILLAVVSSTRNVVNLSLKHQVWLLHSTFSVDSLLFNTSPMFKSFFFSLSPLQCSLHPKHTAKRFTSSTEEEKLFLALIAVISTEHPAYPAHKVQNLILLGCTTNTSAIKQTETAHLICYQLTTKVSLLNLSLFFATKKKGH